MRATELGKYYGMDDDQLPWVYARSEESGGIFGLEVQTLVTSVDFENKLLSVSYSKHISRNMHRDNLVTGPTAVKYVESYGDGTCHGATWGHFADLTRAVSDPVTFRKLDDHNLELQLDGMQNMALEGANRHGGGWAVIHEGLVDARSDVLAGNSYRQEQLYVGLGWLASNFKEREKASVQKLVTSILG